VRPKDAETPTPAPKPTQVAKVEPPVKAIETPAPRPTPKVDTLAKLIETPTPMPTRLSRPFDPNAISRSLSAIKPVATPSAVATEASAAAQGLPQHNAPKMALSMKVGLDNWLQDAYRGCWSPPPTPPGDKYVAEISVEFAADGSLAGQPKLINPPSDPAWRAYAESARRAVLKCNPLKIPQQYSPFFEEWRSKTVHFDPDNELG
jgi:colicin import membrane protein